MKALLAADGKVKEAEIPNEAADEAKTWREKLVEAVAETDDDLLAKYLEEGSIAEDEMVKALGKAIGQGSLVPVMATAATKGIGVQPLMDLIVHEFPSPAEAGRRGRGHRPARQAGRHAGARSQGAAVRRRLQDHRRSARGQALAVPRVLRHLQGR